MRIFFRHESTSSFAMLETIAGRGIDVVPADSNMESTRNFVFDGVEFLLMYDRASAANRAIYPFMIESLADNDGEGTERTRKATNSLHDLLTDLVQDIELDEDE
jgi:hypothetical protein